jgi:hypothetical protein
MHSKSRRNYFIYLLCIYVKSCKAMFMYISCLCLVCMCLQGQIFQAEYPVRAILTETLACFLPGRAKDLSALLYNNI